MEMTMELLERGDAQVRVLESGPYVLRMLEENA